MSFFKGLLEGAMGAGAAYMQHVKFVKTAIAASQDQRGELLASYVQGLSTASFAGFKVTLVTLGNRETDGQIKQAILSLLQNADAAYTHQTQTAPMPTVTNTIPDEGGFQRDVSLVNHWFDDFTEDHRKEAVVDHLLTLDLKGYSRFATNLEQIRQIQIQNLQHHESNEHLAWGRYIEDQMAYANARERTGQRDPGFMRELRSLQEALSKIEWAITSSHDLWQLIERKRATSPY